MSMPQLFLMSGTRAMAGAGLALLLSENIRPEQRRAVGWTLLLISTIITLPLALAVFSERSKITDTIVPKLAA